MSKIKIVFYIDSFMIGGMHRQVLYLVKDINKSIFEPIVCVTGFHGGLKDSFIDTECKLHDLKWKGGFDIKISARLGRFLKKEEPQLIFICEPQNLIYYRLSKIFYSSKITQIGSFRALTFWLGHVSWKHKIIDNLLAKWLYKTSDRIVVNSEALKKHYSKIINVSSNSPIEVIYNGSDFNFGISKERERIRREIDINDTDCLIIMVARLDPWKDFYTLIRASEIVVNANPKAKFLFLGSGGLRNELDLFVVNKKLTNNVFFLGEKKDIYNYINASDICVLSTHGEGFSNSILEYMALAKPVIATDVGGNSEVLGTTKDCGFLIPPNSPELFANSIEKLMNNKLLMKSMSESGKARIHNLCSIKKYIASYEEFFLGLKFEK